MNGAPPSTPRSGSGAPPRRLVLVNQFVPPAQPPTARLLGELIQGAQQQGWQTVALGRRRGYGSKAVAGWRRYLRDLAAHIRIGWGLLWVRRPSLIVCLSDPPCLLVTVAIMARLRRAAVIHWAMDVYPETALALGQLRPGPLSRSLARAMAWAYRQCRRCVALDQDMARQIARASDGCVPVEVLAPWPPPIEPTQDRRPQPSGNASDRVWLYSGNLGRAHDWRTMIDTQRALEERARKDPRFPVWRLVLQGGGASMAEAQVESERLGLRRIEFRPYAADGDLLSSLLAADVLIATLKPGLRGLLWPSKLALMRLCGRPIAWIGPVEGAIAKYLRLGGTAGVFEVGAVEALILWLNEAVAEFEPVPPERVAAEVDQIRRQGLETWCRWLASA